MQKNHRSIFSALGIFIVMITVFLGEEVQAKVPQYLVRLQSNTSRDVIFYFLSPKTTAKDIKGKSAKDIEKESLDGKAHILGPKTQQMVVPPAENFKIAVARQGNSLLKRNLGKRFALCGPIDNGDAVIISTKKTIGVESGTKCKVAKDNIHVKHDLFDLRKKESERYKPIEVTKEMPNKALQDLAANSKLTAIGVVGKKGAGAIQTEQKPPLQIQNMVPREIEGERNDTKYVEELLKNKKKAASIIRQDLLRQKESIQQRVLTRKKNRLSQHKHSLQNGAVKLSI